jgi:hypothetical protein
VPAHADLGFHVNAVSSSIDRPAPERAIERAAGPELAETVTLWQRVLVDVRCRRFGAGELLHPPKDK